MKSTSVIWKTVVFSAAMLGGAAGCGKQPATNNPSNTAGKTGANGQNGMAPTTAGSASTPDPNQDPCAGGPDPRPRGTDDGEGGGMGRGFVLS